MQDYALLKEAALHNLKKRVKKSSVSFYFLSDELVSPQDGVLIQQKKKHTEIYHTDTNVLAPRVCAADKQSSLLFGHSRHVKSKK